VKKYREYVRNYRMKRKQLLSEQLTRELKEKNRQWQRKWMERNKDRCREYVRNYRRKRRLNQLVQVTPDMCVNGIRFFPLMPLEIQYFLYFEDAGTLAPGQLELKEDTDDKFL
jgi:hypothetical protein